MHILIIRGSTVLAKPDGTVPTLAEVENSITIIESYDHKEIRVVTSSTGSMPGRDGWEWVSIRSLQNSSEKGDLIGEAMLCGM